MSRYPDSEGYNGYSNYPTYCACLWLSSMNEDVQRQAYSLANRTDLSGIEKDDAFKDWIEQSAPDPPASLYSDLLSWAISEINWTEVTEAFAED